VNTLTFSLFQNELSFEIYDREGKTSPIKRLLVYFPIQKVT